MKVTKAITLDFEIIERLSREKNVSGLINKLLNEHYSMEALKELPMDELKRRLSIAEKKEQLEKQLAELKNEELLNGNRVI